MESQDNIEMLVQEGFDDIANTYASSLVSTIYLEKKPTVNTSCMCIAYYIFSNIN